MLYAENGELVAPNGERFEIKFSDTFNLKIGTAYLFRFKDNPTIPRTITTDFKLSVEGKEHPIKKTENVLVEFISWEEAGSPAGILI